MKAFITGITGFAGSYLAEHLLASGDVVHGSSHSGRWRADAPGQLVERTSVLAWDVRRPVAGAVRDQIAALAPDWIFHLAAMSVPADCGRDEPAPEAVATNVEGTRHTLQLATSLSPRPRVLLASSCYVYAAVDLENPRVDEHAALGPSGGYGKTKLAAEQTMFRAMERARIEGVVARVFQHTGARQSPRMIVPQWAQQFAAGGSEPIEVQSLQANLDLTDVRDVVRAYRALAERGQFGAVYNVGSGTSICSGDIFQRLRDMVDPGRGVVEAAPGRRQHPIADITRIEKQTLWRPEIPLETTLRDILDYWTERQSA